MFRTATVSHLNLPGISEINISISRLQTTVEITDISLAETRKQFHPATSSVWCNPAVNELTKLTLCNPFRIQNRLEDHTWKLRDCILNSHFGLLQQNTTKTRLLKSHLLLPCIPMWCHWRRGHWETYRWLAWCVWQQQASRRRWQAESVARCVCRQGWLLAVRYERAQVPG